MGCVSTCSPVRCSNGQLGYGRRRRDVSSQDGDPNKVYEISMSTIIKMECDDCEKEKYLLEKGSLREKLEFKHADEAALSALFEEFGSSKFVNFESGRSGAETLSGVASLTLCAAALLTMMIW